MEIILFQTQFHNFFYPACAEPHLLLVINKVFHKYANEIMI